LVCFAKEEYPSPKGYVNDFANIVPQSVELQITRIIKELEQKTGAEVALATFQSIPHGDLEGFAVKLYEDWGIGKREQDNGVLILLVMDERRIRIEVGYGLEHVLPDGLCGEIIRTQMVPLFKEGRFGEGLYLATFRIASIISEKQGVEISGLQHVPHKEEISTKPRPVGGGLLKLFSLLFFLILILGLRSFFFPFFLFGTLSGGYWSGGGYTGRGGFGGGFGGFGGGISGGGGASGSW
jgi:uncharacterized protein